MSETEFGTLQDFAGDVSRETFDILKKFESELRRWNSRINLVAQSTVDDLWRRHICDCAQLARLKPAAKRWLDLGSGGGLPGLVIAAMIRERAGAMVELVESNRKKAAFLTHAAGLLGLPARVHARRIGAVHDLAANPEIVTARALAPLDELLELSSHWLCRGAVGLFQKGRDYRLEIEQSAARWQFDLVQHRRKLDRDGMILEISGLKAAGGPTGQQCG
jgi:16S rRNA (guanine527-N7)-methyltransferase